MLTDHYPETLRDIYDKIAETIVDTGAADSPVDIALYVTEWIRKHWSRRTLIPSWWGPIEAKTDEAESGDLPGVVIQVDPLRTARGRELRDVVCSILISSVATGRPCDLATAIAARVEQEWSRQQVYIPKAAGVDRAIRDAQIWRDFGGFQSIGRVVETHDLCQSVIYDVFRRLQKDKEAREQPTLPGF